MMVTSTNLDIPLALVTLLACLSLIYTFRTLNPEKMYWGLHAYVWFLGLAFCYVQDGSGRMLLFGLPALPDFSFYRGPQYGLLFILVFSLILLAFRAGLIEELSLLMGLQGAVKQPDSQSATIYRPYQQGYQLAEEFDERKNTLRYEEQNRLQMFDPEEYGEYEKPQSSYPEDPQDMPGQQ